MEWEGRPAYYLRHSPPQSRRNFSSRRNFAKIESASRLPATIFWRRSTVSTSRSNAPQGQVGRAPFDGSWVSSSSFIKIGPRKLRPWFCNDHCVTVIYFVIAVANRRWFATYFVWKLISPHDSDSRRITCSLRFEGRSCFKCLHFIHSTF